jgi:Spy/CpxP family protein refolding chaperone
MKMNRLIAISLASLAIVGSTAFAASTAAQPDNSARWIEQRVAKRVAARIEGRLKMTDAQREHMKSSLQQEQPAMVALAQRGKQERDELAQMNTFDDVQVRELAQRYAATDTDILVERAKVRMELRAVLNDAQRQQVDTLRAKVGERFEERLGSLIDAI